MTRTVQITPRISTEMRNRLATECDKRGVTQGDMIMSALDVYFTQDELKESKLDLILQLLTQLVERQDILDERAANPPIVTPEYVLPQPTPIAVEAPPAYRAPARQGRKWLLSRVKG